LHPGLRFSGPGDRSLARPERSTPAAAICAYPETIEFLARKKTEGKTHREAVRSLKRHLASRIWQLLDSARG
jgi:hypothetical protein